MGLITFKQILDCCKNLLLCMHSPKGFTGEIQKTFLLENRKYALTLLSLSTKYFEIIISTNELKLYLTPKRFIFNILQQIPQILPII